MGAMGVGEGHPWSRPEQKAGLQGGACLIPSARWRCPTTHGSWTGVQGNRETVATCQGATASGGFPTALPGCLALKTEHHFHIGIGDRASSTSSCSQTGSPCDTTSPKEPGVGLSSSPQEGLLTASQLLPAPGVPSRPRVHMEMAEAPAGFSPGMTEWAST